MNKVTSHQRPPVHPNVPPSTRKGIPVFNIHTKETNGCPPIPEIIDKINQINDPAKLKELHKKGIQIKKMIILDSSADSVCRIEIRGNAVKKAGTS